MLDNDNIWKEKFNDESLNDEDWLAPNPDLFDNISNTIQVEEEKKKRRWLIIFFIIGLIPLLLLLLPENSTQSEIDLKSNSSLTDQNSNNKQEYTTVSLIADKVPNSNPPSTKNELDSKKEILPVGNLNDITKKENKNITHKKALITEVQNELNLDKEFLTEEFFFEDVETQINSINENLNASPYVKIQPLNAVEDIQKISFFLLQDKKYLPPQIPQPDRIETAPTSFKRHKINFGISSEFWNFNLNNNYVTALDPADFSHGSGNGYSAFVGFSQAITKKLYFDFGIAFQQVHFESGHNSSIAYNLSSEVDEVMSNQFDLTMASPLGFLNSEVLIQRQNTTNDAVTDLALDLNNEHTLSSIDLSLGLNLEVLNYKNLSVGIGIRGGINQVLQVDNKLATVNTNHSNFLTESTLITSDQNSINKRTPFIGSSINLEYCINDKNGIGINASLTNSINPIYQEGDFSTKIMRNNIGLYWSYSF